MARTNGFASSSSVETLRRPLVALSTLSYHPNTRISCSSASLPLPSSILPSITRLTKDGGYVFLELLFLIPFPTGIFFVAIGQTMPK